MVLLVRVWMDLIVREYMYILQMNIDFRSADLPSFRGVIMKSRKEHCTETPVSALLAGCAPSPACCFFLSRRNGSEWLAS